MRRSISVIVLLFVVWGCATTSSLLEKSEDNLVTIRRHEILAVGNIRPSEKIPTQYASYTFFLFPDRRWFRESTPRKLKELYDEFRNFGNAIGENNLAVWFFNKKGDPDMRRASEFASMFHIDAGSGPYVVYVKPKRPVLLNIVRQYGSNVIEEKVSLFDLKSVSEEDFFDKFAIDFKKLEPEGTTKLLSLLASQIKGKSVDFSVLQAERDHYSISIWVSKLGDVGSSMVDSMNTMKSKFQERQADFQFEMKDMKRP